MLDSDRTTEQYFRYMFCTFRNVAKCIGEKERDKDSGNIRKNEGASTAGVNRKDWGKDWRGIEWKKQEGQDGPGSLT